MFLRILGATAALGLAATRIAGAEEAEQTVEDVVVTAIRHEVFNSFPESTQKTTWSDVSPRLSLEYSPTENLLFYASYSEGFERLFAKNLTDERDVGHAFVVLGTPRSSITPPRTVGAEMHFSY